MFLCVFFFAYCSVLDPYGILLFVLVWSKEVVPLGELLEGGNHFVLLASIVSTAPGVPDREDWSKK